MTLTLTLNCAGARLYNCHQAVGTVLSVDDTEAPDTLAPALSRLAAQMDMGGWLRRPFERQISGFCFMCLDRLHELATGTTVLATPEMLHELLQLADTPTDSLDTIRSWPPQGFDTAARKAARRIVTDPRVHAAQTDRHKQP